MPDLCSEFKNVGALHPSQVIDALHDLEILCLGALIEGGTGQGGVTAPGEIRKRSGYARPLQTSEAAHASLLIEVCALAECLEIDHLRQIAEAGLMNNGGS